MLGHAVETWGSFPFYNFSAAWKFFFARVEAGKISALQVHISYLACKEVTKEKSDQLQITLKYATI